MFTRWSRSARLPQAHLGAVAAMVVLLTASLGAQEDQTPQPGHSSLDEAMRLRVTAQSMADLEQIVQLAESAIEKGLDEDNQAFAKQMIAASLLQHATRLSAGLLEPGNRGRKAFNIRKFALDDLKRALTYDNQMGEVHLLLARLEAMPGGNAKRAVEAVNRAIELFQGPEQKNELSSALVLRGRLEQEDQQQRLDDFSKALELNPNNLEAWRSRGAYYIQNQDFEKAIADLKKMLELDGDNLLTLKVVADLLLKQKEYDQALQFIDRTLELDLESQDPYLLKARVYLAQQKIDEALQSLAKAIRTQPRDIRALLMRAQIHVDQQEDEATKKAIDDLTTVLKLRPGLEQALIFRSIAYGELGDFDHAIADLRKLVTQHPDQIEYRLQVAAYYIRAQRPRRAIEEYDAILDKFPTDDRARLGQADALLSTGDHRGAVKHYEEMLKKEPKDVLDSILNNLAWVLATSPDDDVRNGERAVELARRACELTEYKAPHILSTLAASYAETGDFEQATEWSGKAVELGKDHRDAEQLKAELDSYRQKRPFRERQVVEEKVDPDEPNLDGLDFSDGDSEAANEAVEETKEDDSDSDTVEEDLDDD